jgi:hypothetical protein
MNVLTANDRKWLVRLVTTGCIVVLAIAAYFAARVLVHGEADASSPPGSRSYLVSPWATVLFFVMGAWLLFQGMRLRRRQLDSAHWPATNGLVVETQTVTLARYTRVPAVICDYSVGGRQYRSDPILLGPVDAKVFQPGKMLALRYDPQDPAIVVAGTQMGMDQILLGALVLGFPFLLALIM